MSEVQNTTPVAPLESVAEPTTATTTAPVTETSATPTAAEAIPAITATEPVKAEETAAAPVETKAEETAATETPATEAKEEKAVEPVSEGQLGYKAPGLLKQFTFSKKEFWLSDSPVTPQNLDMYMRGEKAEVSHPVVAWASETGKGLMFFNKKGDTDRTHPAGVLPLYEATDLKKMSPHEFSFELSGHKHSFKAAGDAERDGWYLALEKAIELGKASKETVRESPSYKSEMEKLNTPSVIGGAAGASKARSQSRPKKSTDLEKSEPARTGSSSSDEPENKKAKSRSTSRGMLNKLKGKKEEAEVKREEKKEEKEEKKEEDKLEKEAEKTGEATPAVAGTAAALDAPSTAERAVAAPAEEPVEALPTAVSETTATPETTPVVVETKAEEKPKPSKRGSIFGKIPGAWSSMKSPSKEKDQKDAELKPETPAKDAGVSENPPVLPETTTTEPIDSTAPTTAPEIVEPTAEATKAGEVLTPRTEKKNFLAGLGFNKRTRSVSPSAQTPTEAPAVPAKDEPAVTEPVVKSEEPVAEIPVAAAPATTEPAVEKPEEKIAEPKSTDATSPGAKRSSVLGNFSSLGRRASKAFGGMKTTPKKENATPATTATEPKTEPTVTDKPTETPAAAPLADENKENKPEAVSTGAPAPVVASA